MKNQRIKWLFFVMFLLYACNMTWAAAKSQSLSQKVQDVINKFPAVNAANRDLFAQELLQLGSKGIVKTCRLLVPAGAGDDAKVRFALHGIATFVNNPGEEENRQMYARALIKVLDSADMDKEVKAFIIRQIQLVGKQESISPLAKFLVDEQLCDPAAQALVSIGTDEAEKVLLESFDHASRLNRITIIKALGELRSQEATFRILKYAYSADDEMRQVSLYALANIGDPVAEGILNKTMIPTGPFERAQAPVLYLLFAQRLAEAGKKRDAARICHAMISNYTAPQESQISCKALSLLVSFLGENAFGDLLDAMHSPNREFRAHALMLANKIPGEIGTEIWIKKMEKVPDEVQAEIITMLGHRGDKIALPTLKRKLQSSNESIRLAAIVSASRLGGADVVDGLMPLWSSQSNDEILALKRVFLLFPKDQILPQLATLLPELPAFARVQVIDILAAREATEYAELIFSQLERDDPDVRTSALSALEKIVSVSDMPRLLDLLISSSERKEIPFIQNAIVASAYQVSDLESRAVMILDTLETVQDPQPRADLLRLLGRIGGKQALETVIQETSSLDPKIQTAAVYALSQWPDMSAAEALMDVCRATKERKYVNLALQGYVRMLSASDLSQEKKLEFFKQALDIPIQPAEARIVLDGLVQLKTLEALKLVSAYFEDRNLRARAGLTAQRIALPSSSHPGLYGPEVIFILQKAYDVVASESSRERIQEYIQILKQDEGFTYLFNGKDLTGWVGGTQGYGVENGKIVVLPDMGSGNLYTEREYSDFILRFEFKLTPGANNGLGIRTPLEGDAAYVGMELQIIDNPAPEYQNLKPYQYHGSVYGVVPAKRGFLNLIGEWNSQEVIAQGNRITVILNGETIVDADILAASTPQTLDGRDHPGLKRKTGHIGFLGHGSRVEFRNIRIKELK